MVEIWSPSSSLLCGSLCGFVLRVLFLCGGKATTCNSSPKSSQFKYPKLSQQGSSSPGGSNNVPEMNLLGSVWSPAYF